jgi:hypothetical protein
MTSRVEPHRSHPKAGLYLIPCWLVVLTLCADGAVAQQIADTTFFSEIANPAYAVGHGPVVLIDEAHNNFHTAEGRYLAFATLTSSDLYVPHSRPKACRRQKSW